MIVTTTMTKNCSGYNQIPAFLLQIPYNYCTLCFKKRAPFLFLPLLSVLLIDLKNI